MLRLASFRVFVHVVVPLASLLAFQGAGGRVVPPPVADPAVNVYRIVVATSLKNAGLDAYLVMVRRTALFSPGPSHPDEGYAFGWAMVVDKVTMIPDLMTRLRRGEFGVSEDLVDRFADATRKSVDVPDLGVPSARYASAADIRKSFSGGGGGASSPGLCGPQLWESRCQEFVDAPRA